MRLHDASYTGIATLHQAGQIHQLALRDRAGVSLRVPPAEEGGPHISTTSVSSGTGGGDGRRLPPPDGHHGQGQCRPRRHPGPPVRGEEVDGCRPPHDEEAQEGDQGHPGLEPHIEKRRPEILTKLLLSITDQEDGQDETEDWPVRLRWVPGLGFLIAF